MAEGEHDRARSAAPPWSVGDLVARLGASGQDDLGMYGPFVLVGHTSTAERPSGWSFATQVGAPSEADSRRDRSIDQETIVYPVVKRSSLFTGVILVGRARTNDICIEHTAISKLHARIRVDHDCFWVEDAGSRNGTYVESERVREETPVYAGDTLRFGPFVLRVYEGARFAGLLRRMRG